MSVPTTCKSCGAEIVWLKTVAGKNMPVDIGSYVQGTNLFDPQRHVSHFATCPNADQHRNKAPTGEAAEAGRLHPDRVLAGNEYLERPDGCWFFSLNLKDAHPDDLRPLLGNLARIIHHQDRRIDNAIKEFAKLRGKIESHQLDPDPRHPRKQSSDQ